MPAGVALFAQGARAAARPGRGWRAALVAALPLLLGAGPLPPASARLPAWLVGEWEAVEVRQDAYGQYGESDPKHRFPGRAMTVTPDQLTFVSDVCEVGQVRQRRGPVSVPTRDIAGVGLDRFGLPPEHRPVTYLAIQCARSLVGNDDGTDMGAREGVDLTWYVIVRSPTEIDMPFLQGSFIRFRKASPTS